MSWKAIATSLLVLSVLTAWASVGAPADSGGGAGPAKPKPGERTTALRKKRLELAKAGYEAQQARLGNRDDGPVPDQFLRMFAWSRRIFDAERDLAAGPAENAAAAKSHMERLRSVNEMLGARRDILPVTKIAAEMEMVEVELLTIEFGAAK